MIWMQMFLFEFVSLEVENVPIVYIQVIQVSSDECLEFDSRNKRLFVTFV